jgi:hypothetical protein
VSWASSHIPLLPGKAQGIGLRAQLGALVALLATMVLATACGTSRHGQSTPTATAALTIPAPPTTSGPPTPSVGPSSSTPTQSLPSTSPPSHPSTRPTSHPSTPPPTRASDRWGSPVLTDDFGGPTLSPQSWWIYNSPDKTPPRSPNSVRVSGGELQLIGGVDPALGKDVSGGVASRLNQMYGRWEARIRVDQGAGYSAVVLLWPKSDQWPTDGEVDIAEINRGSRQSALNYLHNGADDAKVGHSVAADFTVWHTVAVDWLPDRVTFYLDGVAQYTETRARYIPSTSPMHMTLQFDQGCDTFIECRTPATPPQVIMHVDWIRVFKAR